MRVEQLKQWCQEKMGCNVDLNILSGDAGFRCYYRFEINNVTMIAVDAPPETEKNHEFVYLSNLFLENNISAPRVLFSDLEQGFLILNDLGPDTLLSHLNESTSDQYYARVIDILIQMQELSEFKLDSYDGAKLKEEMQLFRTWFIGEMLDYQPTKQEHQLIDQLFDRLTSSALDQPKVMVHRDFHSRNIMLQEELSLIDFQDAVYGPITYDLVSLLKDCYIEWPQEKINGWLKCYIDQVQRLEVWPKDTSLETLKYWFDYMGLQRHIKVLGIFARLSLRDQKHGYLSDLPLVIKYVLNTLKMYPNEHLFVEFEDFFNAKLMPRIITRPWMIEGGK
jgi:N-acetylmuramate 1-kinase